ncbi:MAG: HYR domain-containing protein, partial [Bacteroidota bacterium]
MRLTSTFSLLVLLFVTTLSTSSNVSAQTTLSVGDANILWYSAINPDQFGFVTFVELSVGTRVYFTENGSSDAGVLDGGEAVIELIVNTTVPEGTIIQYPDTDFGTWTTIAGQLGLALTGDQLFIFQDGDGVGGADPQNNPVFISGINAASQDTGNNCNFQDNMQTNSPPSLTAVTFGDGPGTFLAVGAGIGCETENDFVYFTGGSDFSDIATAKAAIQDPDNWLGGISGQSTAQFDAAVAAFVSDTDGITAPDCTNDTERPTITSCEPVTLQLDDAGNARLINNAISFMGSDNCTDEGDLLINTFGSANRDFTCEDIGPNTVTIQVQDEAGNFSAMNINDDSPGATCDLMVTIVDDMAPTFTSAPDPAIVTLECIEDLPDEAPDSPSATDNCTEDDDIMITVAESNTAVGLDGSLDPMSGLVFLQTGATGSSLEIQIVENTMAPLELPSGSPVMDLVFTALPSPAGFRRWRARNPNAFPVEARAERVVGSGPDIYFEVPANTDLFFFTDDAGGANTVRLEWLDENGTVQENAKAHSNEIDPDLEFIPEFCATRVYTFTATDAAGNSSMVTQTFRVECDDTPPTFMTCPEEITVTIDENRPLNANGFYRLVRSDLDAAGVVAEDNCAGTIAFVYLNGSRLFGCDGNNNDDVVEIRARDQSDNLSDEICAIDLVVIDGLAPEIDCPVGGFDLDVELDADGLATVAATLAGLGLDDMDVEDNCDEFGELTANILSGSLDFDCMDIGADNTITFTVSDVSDNESEECTVNINVLDVTPPKISCPEDITDVENDPGECGAVVSYSASAVDNCMVLLEFSPASGSFFEVGTTTVTVTTTDVDGNPVTPETPCTFDVTVLDTELPELTCPADETIDCDATPPAPFTAQELMTEGLASDNCSFTVEVNETNSQQDAACGQYNFTIKREYIITDPAGLSVDCKQFITVEDVTPPVLTCNDISVSADENCEALVPLAITATDNCASTDELTITYSLTDGGASLDAD